MSWCASHELYSKSNQIIRFRLYVSSACTYRAHPFPSCFSHFPHIAPARTYKTGVDDKGTPCGDGAMLFIQARGVSGLSAAGLTDVIPGFTLPPTARLQLQARVNVTYQPLDYMTMADVSQCIPPA
jgi:hypothetical protein